MVPSPGGGIGAAIAAAAGIAGGIAGVENEWESQVKRPADEIEMKPQKPWTVWDVRLSRNYRKNQQASTLASLTSLANHSTDMTTTLDSTYSSLFDKLTNLHGAIYAFKDLLDITSELRRQMTSSITELKADADDRIKSVNKFQSQITKIDDLQKRMTDSHKRAAELNKRLDAARETISDWQQSEVEWAINFRKKLRVGLSIFTGIMSIVIMLCFLRLEWSVEGQTNPEQPEDPPQTCENPAPVRTFIFASAPSHLNDFATAAGRLDPLDICLDSVSGLAETGL
ncbi:hypothetical protein KEM54_003155 [Ascosphaera aggregata]|nr:hypothetical protein KEM54_003155 [Ascosphaera aggregata]